MEENEITQETIDSTITEYKKRIEFKELAISLCELEIDELKRCIFAMQSKDIQRSIIKQVSRVLDA